MVNLTVNICNVVKKRKGADSEADMCAAYEWSEDRQTTVFVFIRDK
jgi:hypothetical protein